MKSEQPASEWRNRRALWQVSFLLIIAMSWMVWTQTLRTLDGIRLAFANEQTQIFAEMRAKALESNPDEAVDYLRYVVGYYPSGTKQRTGSAIDTLVERARSESIAAIIDHLRCTTGQDFGDDPSTAWKYARAAKNLSNDRIEPGP